MSDKFLQEISKINNKTSETTNKVAQKGFNFMKERAVDILLVFIIMLVNGAFDFFVLGRSTKIATLPYWNRVFCRIVSYTCASVLGFRFGLPLARQLPELLEALEEHKKLYTSIDTERFETFIEVVINKEIKINAWKWKVKNQLKWLNFFTKRCIIVWYSDHLDSHFGNVKGKKLDKLKKKALEYETKRKNLEMLLTDAYINNNIDTLNIKYYRVSGKDFKGGTASNDYEHYITRGKTAIKSAENVVRTILITAIISCFMGSIAISIDKEILVQEGIAFVTSIVEIVLNFMLDVALVIYKFISAFMKSPNIVREQEVATTLDRITIMKRFIKTEQNSATEKITIS